MTNTLYLPELREMLARNDTAGLKEFCTALHPARTAEFMEGLSAEEAWTVLQYAELPLRVETFGFFEQQKQIEILESIDRAEMAELVGHLPPDDRVDLLHDVRLSIWYDWVNDGPDPNEREHNFDTVANDRTPKPSYRSVQTLTGQLSGYRIVRRLPTGEADYVLLCANKDGKRKLAAWTTGEPHTVGVDVGPVRGDEVTAVDLFGQPIQRPAIAQGRPQLALKGSPCYVTLPDAD